MTLTSARTEPYKRILLAFVPLLVFLLVVPLVGYGDELSKEASPREAAMLSGKKQRRAKPPVIAKYRIKREMRVTVTAYSSTQDQTDSSPFITASGARVAEGLIAHNGLPFGTRVRFPEIFGERVFVVQDRMNRRYGPYMADIWMRSRHQAKQWGVKRITMQVLEPLTKKTRET